MKYYLLISIGISIIHVLSTSRTTEHMPKFKRINLIWNLSKKIIIINKTRKKIEAVQHGGLWGVTIWADQPWNDID